MSGFLNIAEAAAFLGVSIRTIRRRLPSIPHYRTDFGLRFSPSDLMAYMKQFRREPTARAAVDLNVILRTLDRTPRRQIQRGKSVAL